LTPLHLDFWKNRDVDWKAWRKFSQAVWPHSSTGIAFRFGLDNTKLAAMPVFFGEVFDICFYNLVADYLAPRSRKG
jgi:hypothetical protein